MGMYFKPVKIDYSELVTRTEWNRLLLERLTLEDKKTIGMLIFLAKLRTHLGVVAACRMLLGNIDEILAGEEHFAKHLVELTEEYLRCLFGEEVNPGESQFTSKAFLVSLENVYEVFVCQGVVDVNVPPF